MVLTIHYTYVITTNLNISLNGVIRKDHSLLQLSLHLNSFMTDAVII